MHAVIMAGGKGTRLAPYTTVLPKPLMPVDSQPILEIVLRQLKSQGFDRITISVGHLAELIMAFFGCGEKWGLKIDYAIEDEPQGTMGALWGYCFVRSARVGDEWRYLDGSGLS